MSLPPHLEALRSDLEARARGYGLDFFETRFEIVPYDRINEIAAYGGFPTRYPHWRFGMEYDQLSKSSEYGLSKIYEMVINTDPAYAYLLEGNALMDQRTVIAHVFGHVDFFKNNYYFSQTDRKMVDKMANHATQVRRLIDKLGLERVEAFIDVCLSVDNLVDPYAPFLQRAPAKAPEAEELTGDRGPIFKLPAREYMEDFINPPEFIEEQKRKHKEEVSKRRHFPYAPQRDVLGFLLEYAPLEGWEFEILNIIRAEAYYFAPQGMTKIMNEGWATYWHSKILTEGALPPDEIIDYAETYARIVATSPGSLNPYALGVEIWRDIEERWNRGMFGDAWESCERLDERERFDLQLGLGRQKMFQVRALYNDISFLDEFLTPDLVERQRLYNFGYDPRSRSWRIETREFENVKRRIIDGLTNFGNPLIAVRDANFRNSAQLLLSHRYTDAPLRADYAEKVLTNLYQLWKRPVWVETFVPKGNGRDKPAPLEGVLLGFDGERFTQEKWPHEPIPW
mgnify:CR=1 FL=1